MSLAFIGFLTQTKMTGAIVRTGRVSAKTDSPGQVDVLVD